MREVTLNEVTLEHEVAILKGVIVRLIAANDGIAALQAATEQRLCKQKGERDPEFVKRLAKAYIIAALKHEAFQMEDGL